MYLVDSVDSMNSVDSGNSGNSGNSLDSMYLEYLGDSVIWVKKIRVLRFGIEVFIRVNGLGMCGLGFADHRAFSFQ